MAPFLLLIALFAQFGQADAGELRVLVRDQGGLPVQARVAVLSDVNQVSRALDTDTAGAAIARRLPFGRYRVLVTRDGFAPSDGLVEIRTAIPVEYRVTLAIAAVAASVEVAPDATLLDPKQTTTVRRVGADLIQQRPAAVPGRAVAELINTQPGWLLEAGGSLHPRGSENQAQYVVDGLPITDNRAPGFAPELDAEAIHSIGVITGGYPAEYGRKLGGVIEVATVADPRRGFHGGAAGGVGSFGTRSVDLSAGYAGESGSLAASAAASSTDRYLDPPVEDNFTNHGDTWQGALRAEWGRLGVIASHARTDFMVPNEPEQEAAGQRQTRDSRETSARVSYQRILTASAVATANGFVRDLHAGFASNDRATPIAAGQQRELRDGYVKAAIAGHAGVHEWKVGADSSVGRIRERFDYHITNPAAFAPGIRPAFTFDGSATDREHALFVQDQVSTGPWTLKAGLRWDAYRFLVSETAISPRLAAAWSPDPRFALRASYDRAFQTPAVENLLLASSPDVDTLAPSVVRLPVRPSRGNFYELAASAQPFRAARIDASWFDRRMNDFADDDLLLNTGVSFPIAFRRGTVHGAEVKLDIPRWRALSGFLSYTWMRGEADLPVTGGLFLGDERDLAEGAGRFAITQDQRHTLRGKATARIRRGGWVALGATVDSGLPFEDAGDADSLRDAYPQRVLDRVNFDTGRVRPAAIIDGSVGWMLSRTKNRQVQLQADVRNATNTLRVINFAGVFSGTALAAPRTYAVRVRVDF
jgi:hypothetical protein